MTNDTNMNKQARATIFRDRLTGAMTMTGTNLSALARQTGVSRSTVSQLLDTEAARMPNAHLAAGCAEALGVEADAGLVERADPLLTPCPDPDRESEIHRRRDRHRLRVVGARGPVPRSDIMVEDVPMPQPPVTRIPRAFCCTAPAVRRLKLRLVRPL